MIRSTLTYTSAIVLVLACLLWLAPDMAAAMDFEIPLKELSKVKKNPPKAAGKSKKKVKKSAEAAGKSAPEETAPAADAGQSANASLEAGSMVAGEAVPAPQKKSSEQGQQSTVDAETAAPPAMDNAGISHDPHSYLVIGKRTVILTVITTPGEVRSAQCYFRTTADGGNAIVGMVKVPGTSFTYSALIPALAPNAGALRYSFVVNDAHGTLTRSKEYVMPVKTSPVVPGWQLDNFQDKLRISLENSVKPLEGFQDEGISR